METQEQYSSQELLGLDIRKAMGARIGGVFWRARLQSLADVKTAIEHYGIVPMGKSFCLGGDGPYVHMAGEKTWARILKTLETLGFDWTAYARRPYVPPWETPTPQERQIAIEHQVRKLTGLLEEYLATLDKPGEM